MKPSSRIAQRTTVPFMIGADPEIFVGNDNGVRSIVGLIGGTKRVPRPLPIGEGFAVQEDNVAMEFNIPACATKAAFVKAIADATGFLEDVIQKGYGLRFDKRSAVSFPDTELMTGESHIFGCEPDYNAWTKQKNPRPEATDKNLRSCGGHIHIGFEGLDPHEVVKGMDPYAGVPSVLMDNGELRKELYGKAGAFRQTRYGVEYRTLSNYWIFQPSLCEWAYDAVQRCLNAVAQGVDFDSYRDEIIQAIDGNDRAVAARLIEQHQLQTVLV